QPRKFVRQKAGRRSLPGVPASEARGLAQETREVFVFPAPGTTVTRESFFPPIKFFGVNPTPTGGINFLRHDRMQHLVIKHVLEKPARHERLIEKWMNANHPILF